MTFQADRPYNDLPSLPPKEDVETKPVLKACIAARAALAELRVSGQLIPNQAVLINSIPLLEAQASSEIENIVTRRTACIASPMKPEISLMLPRRRRSATAPRSIRASELCKSAL
ncbi:Fic/DOC family N-terminal domain-containing protein [Mesorhizobium sp. M1406]|uniref:Fic/DOC family N-terminal domain-containing protein n=1 Tax=Mesorhizobium sp. M1406 TaxID=2957099 RepID=UPI00333A831E